MHVRCHVGSTLFGPSSHIGGAAALQLTALGDMVAALEHERKKLNVEDERLVLRASRSSVHLSQVGCFVVLCASCVPVMCQSCARCVSVWWCRCSAWRMLRVSSAHTRHRSNKNIHLICHASV